MKSKVKLSFGEPVVVDQAEPEVREWGWCQFPSIEQMENGDILRGSRDAQGRMLLGLPLACAAGRSRGPARTDQRP